MRTSLSFDEDNPAPSWLAIYQIFQSSYWIKPLLLRFVSTMRGLSSMLPQPLCPSHQRAHHTGSSTWSLILIFSYILLHLKHPTSLGVLEDKNCCYFLCHSCRQFLLNEWMSSNKVDFHLTVSPLDNPELHVEMLSPGHPSVFCPSFLAQPCLKPPLSPQTVSSTGLFYTLSSKQLCVSKWLRSACERGLFSELEAHIYVCLTFLKSPSPS